MRVGRGLSVTRDAALRIGDVEFPNRLALAPMAGISDPPFRSLCTQLGAAMTPSEMITADTSLWNSRKSRSRLRTWGVSGPRIIQIAGFDPEMLATAADAARTLGADIVDINMGCPAKKVCRRLAGSALLRDPDLVRRILDRVVERARIPVTLKIRTGWCPESRNGVEIARIAQDCGIAALTVHGRTRACRFSGHAEYETIRRIKDSVNIPVIANGDIDSPEKAISVLKYTYADGIMIGRGARGKPWIFTQIDSHLSNNSQLDVPFVSVRDIILAHLDSLYSFYGEFTGVRVGRKHLTWYAQYRDGRSDFRERVVRVETAREQLELTRGFFDDVSHEGMRTCWRSRGERGDQTEKYKKNDQQEEKEESDGGAPRGSEKQAA